MATSSILGLCLCPTPKTLRLTHQHQRLPQFPSLTKAKRTQSRTVCASATIPATDRLISAASYALPFFNSLQYGRYLMAQYPILGVALDPFLPLVSVYRSVPYGSFVAFFGLYLGVARNPNLSRYARFNAMQAVTLDVLLVLPVLVQSIFGQMNSGVGLRLTLWLHSALFVFSVMCFVYSLTSSLLGRTPYLPFVADAAGRQI